MGDLRAGLLGLGMMGRNHCRALRELDGVELVGIADPSGDRHGAADGVPVHQCLEELIGRGLDLCVVAAPTEDHEPAALCLAEAGIHTLVEKPLAQDQPTARRIADAFQREGLVGCVGHIERYNPALQSLRARLESGEIGEIFQIATRRQGPFPNRIKDVGVVMDLATHDLDLTAWVAGEAFVSVAARTAHKTGREHEDLVAATGLLRGDIVTNHLVNWLTPTKERVTVVTGDRGCFIADTITADLTFYANADVPTEWGPLRSFRGVSEGDMVRFAIPKPEPLVTELVAFRDAILGEAGDVVHMHDGLAAIATAEACLESATKGHTIDLELSP